MMAAAAGSSAREELNVSPAAQPRRGAPAGPTPTLLHDTALHSATNIAAAASTTPITPESLAATLHSCISSPTGTKLAVTTPSESPAGGEGARITLDEEKQIALSQLQELEVAIKVRKVTKVDGRKIRWIEYRARKQAEEEKQSGNSKKRPRRSRSKTKGVENNENEANVNNNNNNNNNNNSSSNSNNNKNNNNNNKDNINNNNSNKTESTMKVEPVSPPITAVGTSNVLESMKQQFLQGTENIEEPVINGKSNILAESSLAGQKRKSGRTRKSAGTSEGGSPTSTSPKKLISSDISPKGANSRTGGASKANSTASSPLFDASLALSSTPTTPLTSDQPLAISIKKNFFSPRSVTKGLREIRKMENGSDGVTTIKTEETTPVSSPSASLHLTTLASAVCDADAVVPENKAPPDPKPQPAETKSSKAACPLIKAAAKLMSQPAAKAKSSDKSATKSKKSSSQKGSAKKVSAKSGVKPGAESSTVINGHTPMVQNGSEEVSLLPSPAVVSALGGAGSKPGSREGSPRMPYDSDSGARKPRGRPPKRVTVKESTTGTATEKSSKKMATLVVDVHNTMNGEPQTVIPISRPVLRRKRTSSNKSPKKVLGKSALDPTGSPDIKSSPAPSPKRQKNSDSKAQSSSATSDTKKGKANKKNNDKPIVIKEEKDNTSASSVNQTQGPPTHTQSTKLTKSVQRAANKAAAPGTEPNTANTNNPPQKKKKVKKPVLKVKTLPAKHKEVSKIVKKSKKVTSIGASKQKKAQPKKSNTIRKYLSTHKGKSVPKGSSNKKEGSQTGPQNSGGEGESESQDPDVIYVKQEEDSPTSNLEGDQPQEKDASQQKDSSMLKTDTTEMEVEQDLLPQESMEPMEIEDSKDKANQASEVPCAPSLVGPSATLGEEFEAEVKPCITDIVPHNETETQTLMDKGSPAVNILGVGQSYEKVSDLPKISFQNNNNINNNNPEEDGVIISDKEITIVKDLSAEKLSTTSDDIKCITSADSDTKPSENVGAGFDVHEYVKDEDLQSQSVSENLQVEEISQQQNSFENEVPSEMEVKAEEDVSDRSKSYSEDMPDIVTLDSSQGNSTYEENMLSGSSLSGMHEENEMPVLEPVSCLTSIPSPSLPERAAPITTLPMVMDELQEEQVLGCDKLSQSVSDPEEQTTVTNDTLIDTANHTSDIVDAKETYPIQDGEVMQTSEVNQTHQFIEPSGCEVQVVGIQTDTLKEDSTGSVLPVSQKSTLKPVKKKEGSVYRKKVKKGLIQGHNVMQLQQRQPEVQEEIDITKVTKAQETSQAGAEEALESREVLDVLPASQKENVEVQDLIPEAQPASLALAPEAHSSSATKTKDKVPRILKQLFQDEGVQNMLKSMSEDPSSIPETSPNSDSGMHKLRPKRITEPMLSSSPELDAMEALFTSSRKKKRGSELDTLYMDEGVLNLLTSKEHNSRRGHQEDAASDISQASSSKSLKVSKTMKPADVTSDTRKRKLSGASTASNASSSSKSLLPPEPKKVRLDAQGTAQDPYEVDAAEEFKEKPVITGYTNLETASNIAKKKTLPVVPLSVKQKNKAIRMQLKLQKQKQLKSTVSEVSEGRQDSRSMVEMSSTPKGPVEMYTGASSLSVPVDSSKSVPPLKIKLASDSVTIKPVPRPILPQQPPEITIVPKPPVRLPIKPQVVESPSLPVHRAVPLPQVRTSPEKPKPHPDHQSPSSQLRRVESFAGPIPPVPGFPSLVRNCDPAAAAAAVAAAAAAAASKSRQRVGGESVRQSQRASVRQSEANYHFRDIALRKFNNFTQIILSPSTTKMKNALNSRVLRELCEALNTLKRDDSVRIVLLTGTGSTFCQGVDLTALQHPNLETRKKNAENLVRGIKDFLKALVQFPKPIIAGVNGNAMGLGVTMLPLFDMVIANDKAEFCLPYAKLGQVPEGGATYTFPNLCGKLQSTQLFLGHKLTARRAQEMGLVSESIWPATYQQELIPKVALLATHSAQSMEATKALMNHHLVTKLELSLESECRLLLQQWTSPHFAHLCKRFLDTQYIHLQKPVSLPL